MLSWVEHKEKFYNLGACSFIWDATEGYEDFVSGP